MSVLFFIDLAAKKKSSFHNNEYSMCHLSGIVRCVCNASLKLVSPKVFRNRRVSHSKKNTKIGLACFNPFSSMFMGVYVI